MITIFEFRIFGNQDGKPIVFFKLFGMDHGMASLYRSLEQRKESKEQFNDIRYAHSRIKKVRSDKFCGKVW